MSEKLEVLLTAQQLQARVYEIAKQIIEDYGQQSLVLIGVLKGSAYFLADLSRALPEEVRLDFVQISSYGAGKTSSGTVQLRKDHDIDIHGQHVIIVEDVVDTGLSLSYLKNLLATRKPASLRTAAMLVKPGAMKEEAIPDYVGFKIENDFVVGYGLDHAERYRNLPYIAILREDSDPKA